MMMMIIKGVIGFVVTDANSDADTFGVMIYYYYFDFIMEIPYERIQ